MALLCVFLWVGVGAGEDGPRFSQFGVSRFAMEVGQATLLCGIFWLQRLGAGGVRARYALGRGPVVGEIIYGGAGRSGHR